MRSGAELREFMGINIRSRVTTTTGLEAQIRRLQQIRIQPATGGGRKPRKRWRILREMHFLNQTFKFEAAVNYAIPLQSDVNDLKN